MWLKLVAALKCSVLCFMAQFHLTDDTINPRLSYAYQQMDAQDLSNTVVFVGDSVIQRMYVGQVFPGAVNFGIGGEATSGICSRITRFRYPHIARAVVIEIGTNDVILEIKPAESEKSLRCILDQITVPVVLAAIHHRTEGFGSRTAVEMNAEIDSLNLLWKNACQEHPNCSFLPSPLGGGSGLPSTTIIQDSGVHPTAEGYRIWAKSLSEALAPILARSAAKVSGATREPPP